ncbi:uncharacterized protein RAG0_10837 [Rhynchosporium agropyri]|uniref:Uncharacterized protein n=1 Tax=Rhynchosporium agropyri TaxID=914238 RepID=A0A1E1L1H1_9HELO|nr:uncharacterized protein RAG0_10837 [Rhynchosporium agropyri]
MRATENDRLEEGIEFDAASQAESNSPNIMREQTDFIAIPRFWSYRQSSLLKLATPFNHPFVPIPLMPASAL